MNSLYTSGVRQTSSIQADLERLRNGDTSASLLGITRACLFPLGQISASLAAMHRTIDDYDSMAKREIIKAKQEKAQMRVQKFRTDYSELRTQFDRLKVEAIAQQEADQRAELISSSGIPSSPSDARRRFQNTPSTSQLHPGLRPDSQVSESPFRGVTPQPGFGSREQHALDEHTFIQNTENRLDEFLAQGREVLDNLVDQRNMLKGTQRRLLDAANTLGLSRDVIGWIERRSTQDMYIFFAGAVFTFFCFYLIWRYLG
ncbi:golgi SNAP receptor complex member bos1 [Armillaria borealis]|uniref:Protein transport protein BOS1 n=1 Tax=Armillaria borealis TaxID=47425 RepID=A0AA39K5G6_9AGAR|nr:golgi SNAP receptor complex member bos1 [Armillaria borealis]